MKFAKYALGALLLLPVAAMAVPVTAIINWTAPINTTTGLPLTAPNNLTGYRVYVSTSPIIDNGNPPQTALVAPNLLTYTYTGDHAAGTTLYARIRAVNSSGDSVFSPQASRTIVIPAGLPSAPGSTNIVVTISVTP